MMDNVCNCGALSGARHRPGCRVLKRRSFASFGGTPCGVCAGIVAHMPECSLVDPQTRKVTEKRVLTWFQTTMLNKDILEDGVAFEDAVSASLPSPGDIWEAAGPGDTDMKFIKPVGKPVIEIGGSRTQRARPPAGFMALVIFQPYEVEVLG